MKKIILWFLVIFSLFYYWSNIKEHLFFMFDIFWSLEVIYRVLIIGGLLYLGTIKDVIKGVYNQHSTLVHSIIFLVLVSVLGVTFWGYEEFRNIIIVIGIVGFVWWCMIMGED
jgi:hypothetical protein